MAHDCLADKNGNLGNFDMDSYKGDVEALLVTTADCMVCSTKWIALSTLEDALLGKKHDWIIDN